MTDEELTVESINIRKAPGFSAGGFEISDLSPGINVIHGPNGAGKSTVARSIQSILWPETSDANLSVLGYFDADGDRWRVDLAAQQARYQRNGAETSGPNLPPAGHRDRYHLPLHDLLQHETRNQSFADRIQQESIGGFDLDAAYDELEFDDSASTRGINEHSAAKQALRDWREAKQQAADLEAQEARLPSLRSRLADAKAAHQRVELYSQAIEYREAQNALEDAEAALETFPPEVADLTGDEADYVRELNERIEKQESRLATAEATVEEATSQLESADLPESGLPNGLLDELRDRRDTLEAQETRLSQLEGELRKAKKRRDEALESVPLDVSHESLANFDPAAWKELEEFAETAEELRANRKAYNAVEDWLGSSENVETDMSTLQRGTQALEQWLAAGEPTDSTQDVSLKVSAVSAALVAGAGIALGALVHPALFAVLIVAVGLLWYGYRAHQATTASSTSSQEPHRESFSQLALEEPDSWSAQQVRDRLHELYTAIAEAQLEHQREERRKALTADLNDLDDQEEQLAQHREELRQQYNVSPETTDIELLVITRKVLDWQSANDDVEGRKAEIEEVEESIEEVESRLESALSEFGYTTATDHAEATGHIRDLEQRKQTHQQATSDLAAAEETKTEARTQISSLQEQRAELYREHGLEDTQLERLTDLCDKVEEYENAQTTVNRKQEVRDKEARKLKSNPQFEKSLLTTSIAELTAKQEEAQQEAEERQSLADEITAIETRVDDAKREYDVEEAIEEKQRSLDALEDRLKEDAASMVGDVLVTYLRDTTDESGRPEVFEQARTILAKITKGRYRLDIDGTSFRAYDSVKEQGFALDELSTGTRLQMLLAVRIAFVEQQEHGMKLPLLLDETLANSDDRRAEVIIESMLELARDGRQVFYFTAQGDEVAKWQRAVEKADGIDSRTVDLAAVRSIEGTVHIPGLEDLTDPEPELPDPASHDHRSYREALDVPPFEPRRGAGSAHIWYIVEDPELVRHLLRVGIETWGQLETLLDRTDGSTITSDEEALESIRMAGLALNEFVKAWEVGRGKRVERMALEETSAVSDTFIDEIADLAREVDGDGETLIQRLRNGAVNRFRSGKMDELERYFEEEGYIQQREPLDTETIRAKLVSRLAREGLSEDEAFDEVHSLFKRLVAHSKAKNRQ